MNYGKNKVVIRGVKYRVDVNENGTFVTSEFGIMCKISPIEVHPSRLKERIKEKWGLKK